MGWAGEEIWGERGWSRSVKEGREVGGIPTADPSLECLMRLRSGLERGAVLAGDGPSGLALSESNLGLAKSAKGGSLQSKLDRFGPAASARASDEPSAAGGVVATVGNDSGPIPRPAVAVAVATESEMESDGEDGMSVSARDEYSRSNGACECE